MGTRALCPLCAAGMPGCRCERSPSYCAVYPPSITNSLPVTNDDSSEARYSTPYAISSVVATRPRGTYRSRSSRSAGLRAASPSCRMGVSTPPGCTELHRMLSRACWIAVTLVNKRTAPLDAIYAGGPMATRPEIDEMFTIEPPPARRMAGMACFVPKNTPLAFTAMMRSQSSSLVSSIPLRITMPALFTRTSPKTTFAPSRAHSFASAAPCPRAPPLISATLPSSLPMFTSLHWTMKVPSPHIFEALDYSPALPFWRYRGHEFFQAVSHKRVRESGAKFWRLFCVLITGYATRDGKRLTQEIRGYTLRHHYRSVHSQLTAGGSVLEVEMTAQAEPLPYVKTRTCGLHSVTYLHI